MRMTNYNESILQSMSNGVITIGDDGNIAKVNAAALKLLKCEHPELVVGQPAAAYFSAENQWIADAIGTVQSTGKQELAMNAEVFTAAVTSEDETAPKKTEPASVNLSAVPLTDPSSGSTIGCMLMIEDITSEKRLKSTMARYMKRPSATASSR